MAGGPRVAIDAGAAPASPGDDVAATVTAGSECAATPGLSPGNGKAAADTAGRDAAPAANVTADSGGAVRFGASVNGSGDVAGAVAGGDGAAATIPVGLNGSAAGAVAAVGTAGGGVPADNDRTALAAASPSPDGAVAGVPVAGDPAATDVPAPGGSAEAGVLGVLAAAVPSAPAAAGDAAVAGAPTEGNAGTDAPTGAATAGAAPAGATTAGDRTGTDAAEATAVAASCCGGTCAAFSAVGASGRTAWAGVLGAARCIPLSSENRSTTRCAIASMPGTWSEAIQAAAQPATTTMTPIPTHAPLRSPPPDDWPSNSACARTRRDNSLTVWRSRSRSASLFTAAASSRSVTACCCSRRWRRASFSAVTVSNAASALATPAEMPSKPRERTNSASWRTAWRFFANWSNNASSSCSSIDGARSVLSAGKRHFMPSGARYWNRANCEIWTDPTAAGGPYPAALAHR